MEKGPDGPSPCRSAVVDNPNASKDEKRFALFVCSFITCLFHLTCVVVNRGLANFRALTWSSLHLQSPRCFLSSLLSTYIPREAYEHIHRDLDILNMTQSKLLSVEEISRHNKDTDCWIVVDGQVWDITGFAPEHPGGPGSK